MKKLLVTCLVVLASSLSALGQATVDERGVYHPTEEEVARNKRIAELLKHPTFISLRLASSPRDVPRESGTDTPAPCKVKDYIGFELFITQNSSETLRLGITSPYYDYRPQLMKDGQLMSYSEKAVELTKRAEVEPHSGSVVGVTVKVGQENRLAFINLDDWYDPLPPARYQLTVRKQFAWEGDWVVSNPVYFEVIPRPAASPIPPDVTIELAPEESLTKKNGIYQVTPEAAVIVQVVNNSNQTFRLNVIDRVYGNRPQLFRDGKLIPYRDDMKQRLAAKETNPRLVEIVNDIILEPTQTWPTAIILKDWYGPLPPGSYKLINRCRFEIDGPWSDESKPLMFEISGSKRP